MSYLNELNEVQKEAVEQINGPVLIVAGPGSGKTRVLTYRIAHMIDRGVDPFRIMALTFTKLLPCTSDDFSKNPADTLLFRANPQAIAVIPKEIPNLFIQLFPVF